MHLNGHLKGCEVAIDAPILDLSSLIDPPGGLPRDAKTGMVEDENKLPPIFESKGGSFDCKVLSLNVLQRQEEKGSIELFFESKRSCCIGYEKTAFGVFGFGLGLGDQRGGDIDA